VFQFESEGMRKHLKDLKPETINDLIAMNALYRPGPMQFIPDYINRKHGKETVEYPHDDLKGILKPTHGIMVYQEQIMRAAQIIGGFTLGNADILRKAMGKKKMEEMEKMKVEFIEGAKAKDIDEKKASEIFAIMQEFAKYGFNRSHSAAYSVLAFQTAYLKANYPAEYMAAVLDNNMHDIKKVEFFMKECQSMGIPVLGPDVNESQYKFAVNNKGQVRFGLGAIKGVGEGPVAPLMEERQKEGAFSSIFDLTKRISSRSVNKRVLESLAQAGAFDCFENTHRAQYFHAPDGESQTLIERALKFGNDFKNFVASSQNSLFGDSLVQDMEEPTIPQAEQWPIMEKLKKEKEMTGIYVSGHPLDDFKLDIKSFATCGLADLKNHKNKTVKVAGIVTKVIERLDKKGRKYGRFTVEDFEGSMEFMLFSEAYLKHRHFLEEGHALFITGKYQQSKFRDDGSFEFNIIGIDLLSEVRDKMMTALTFNLTLEELNEPLVQELAKVCKQNPGKYDVKFRITTNGTKNYSISLFSKSFNIDFTKPVEQFLTNLGEDCFQLN